MGIKSMVTDFLRGLTVIFGKPTAGEGDRKLAKMSNIVMGQIYTYGKNAVRTQVIKSIEGDLRRANKKGSKEAIDKLLRNCLDTPEYMQLLHKLGLNESHLRVMVMQTLKREVK
jgi:hypothetical protein